MSVEPVKGTPGEVFAVFLKLGLTSFGGPIAHLGYYRDELVVRRRWLDETDYADLVAFASFFRDRPPAKSAFPSAFSAAMVFWVALRRGSPSPCPRP
jgi:chromate transporter